MRKLFFLLASLLLLSGWSCGQQVIVTCASSVCPAGTTITVSANPTTIAVGGTSILKAIDPDVSPAQDVTGQCVWTSSNTAILSISNNIATGVSAGSATANCTIGSVTGSSPVTIGVSSLVITYPTCGTPPCLLPNGINATAYGPIQATASGGTLPYTWSVSSGNFNACFTNGNSAFSSAGVLTQQTAGNVTTGVCTPTLQVADSASHTATIAISLTIQASGCVAGPPNYGCTPTVVQQPGAFAPVAYPFSGQYSTCSPGPYPACSGVDNTLVNDPEPVGSGNSSGLYHNPIMRLTNAGSGCGNYTEPTCPGVKQNQGFEVDTGSGDVYHWNTTGTRLSIVDYGSTNYIYAFDESTMQATFLYSSFGSSTLPNTGTMQLPKQPSWSPTLQYIFYAPSNAGGNADGTQLKKWDTTLTSPFPTPTFIYDFASSPNCLPNTITASTDPMNVGVIGGVDTIFEDSFSTSGTQNTAQYSAAYKVGSGCSVWNASNNTITGDWGTTSGPMVCQNCVLTTTMAVGGMTVTTVGGGVFQYVANVTSSNGFNPGDTITLTGASGFNSTYTLAQVSGNQLEWTTNGGSAGSATGGTFTDNTPSPGTFVIHNNKISKNGTYAIVYVSSCLTTCYNKTSPYIWQIGTNKVWTNCPAASGNDCSGHSTSGNLAFYTQYSTPYWASHPFSTPGTPSAFPPNPFSCNTGNYDHHSGYQDDADFLDDYPFVGAASSGSVGQPNYTFCVQGEVFGLYPPSAGGNAGVFKRFGHTYTTTNGCFGAQYAIGSVSQDGKFYAFTSNMQNLGCMNGAASSCTSTTTCSTSNASPRSDVFIVKLQ